jgi:hypothetical protein
MSRGGYCGGDTPAAAGEHLETYPCQKMPFMRQRTMTREIKRPMPENSAIETNCELSEFCKADEEASILFGIDGLRFSGGRDSCR